MKLRYLPAAVVFLWAAAVGAADDHPPTIYLHLTNACNGGSDDHPPAGVVLFTNLAGSSAVAPATYLHATNVAGGADAMPPAGYAHITNPANGADDVPPDVYKHGGNPPSCGPPCALNLGFTGSDTTGCQLYAVSAFR